MTAVLPEYLSVEAWAFEAELNSLAAGASRIEVDIEDGGISLIRVRDDGYGMLPDDAERAVAEHATSKIRTAEDLARVESLGFRGEALHAIGSASHLTLTTNAPGAGSPGFRVMVLAGETVEAGPASHPPGTTVEARELFRNLPVRRSFLGTVRAEMHAGRDNGPLRMRLGLRTAAQALWRGARRRASTP